MAERPEMKHVISLGAGVQSSTMSLMAAHGEITPMPVAAIFADTQAEPKAVYEWLDWLETKLPFPVIRTTKGSLTEDSLRLRVSKDGNRYQQSSPPAWTIGRKGDPVRIMRQCTSSHKLAPIIRELRKLRGKDEAITQWVGISRDEAQRMKPAREPWIVNRYPLVDMRITRQGCLEWMLSHGFDKPPRSACTYCPFRNAHDWIDLRDTEPGSITAARQYEIRLQRLFAQVKDFTGTVWLHRSCQPIDTVDFDALTDDPQLSLFGNECEGMCGV